MISPNFDPRQSNDADDSEIYTGWQSRRALLACAAAAAVLTGAVIVGNTDGIHDQLRFITSVEANRINFSVNTTYADTSLNDKILLAGRIDCQPVAEDQQPYVDILAYGGSKRSEHYLTFLGQVGTVCQADGSPSPEPGIAISDTVLRSDVLDGLYTK